MVEIQEFLRQSERFVQVAKTQRRAITIISGGQTGADRAALDFALAHGIPHGGWCPRGRLAEDGRIALRYNLQETVSADYAERTERNVRDSDATVVFTIGPSVAGGSALAASWARRLGKPLLHLSRDAASKLAREAKAIDEHREAVAQCAARLRTWLAEHKVERLNVAGPRASQEPEVADFVHQVLQAALGEWAYESSDCQTD